MNEDNGARREKKRAKRANGEGSLGMTRDGCWRGTITLVHPDGRRQRVERYGPSQTAVRRKLDAVRKDHDAGVVLDESKLTFGQWLDRCLASIEPTRVVEKGGTVRWVGTRRVQTYRTYAAKAAILKERLGRRPLRALRSDELSRLYAEYADRPRQAGHLHAVARWALRMAVKQQQIARNPTEGAITVAQKQRRMQPPTGPDLARFLGAVAMSDPALAAFVAITAGAGCRPSEAYGLDRRHVTPPAAGEMGEALLSFEQTRLTSGAPVVEPMKTEESTREVPIDARLFDHVRRWMRLRDAEAVRLGQPLPTPLFARPDGTLPHFDALRDRHQRVLRRLTMPEHWRPYDWRHCHATTLLERGAPLPFVSKRLGHKNTAITGTIYSALRPSENVRLARLFGDAMGPPASEATDAAAE